MKAVKTAKQAIYLMLIITAAIVIVLRIAGYKPYVLMSGSMSPQYKTGDLIYIKAQSGEEIEEGDVITYQREGSEVTVTHRVIKADREKKIFETKGDANETKDAEEVRYEEVKGTVRIKIPKLGYITTFVKSPAVKAAMILIVLVILVTEAAGRLKKEKLPGKRVGRDETP